MMLYSGQIRRVVYLRLQYGFLSYCKVSTSPPLHFPLLGMACLVSLSIVDSISRASRRGIIYGEGQQNFGVFYCWKLGQSSLKMVFQRTTYWKMWTNACWRFRKETRTLWTARLALFVGAHLESATLWWPRWTTTTRASTLRGYSKLSRCCAIKVTVSAKIWDIETRDYIISQCSSSVQLFQ